MNLLHKSTVRLLSRCLGKWRALEGSSRENLEWEGLWYTPGLQWAQTLPTRTGVPGLLQSQTGSVLPSVGTKMPSEGWGCSLSATRNWISSFARTPQSSLKVPRQSLSTLFSPPIDFQQSCVPKHSLRGTEGTVCLVLPLTSSSYEFLDIASEVLRVLPA
jgi:hypothetical protein